MHNYLVFIEVPSTAPMYGVSGLQTRSKIRVIAKVEANNSSSACSKASKKLDVPYSKLKALLCSWDDGVFQMEKHRR